MASMRSSAFPEPRVFLLKLARGASAAGFDRGSADDIRLEISLTQQLSIPRL